MTPEDITRMHPDLEQAMAEIREEPIDDAAVEAAAARVWARLEEAAQAVPADHIRDCAGFQALFADYRAGRLTEARAMLVKDHLRECVACRRHFEGKVMGFPAPATGVRRTIPFRWAAAAVVVAGAGITAWFAVNRLGAPAGPAIVQSVNGALYAITPAGIQPLAAGQELPEGTEVRTAKDSLAVLRLGDGSRVEMRERSGFSASQSGRDTFLRLGRGSVIVEAAKRSSGHLYVNTADCRVAVTGTVFSVSAGLKGSRVSVIRGEVRVAQNNEERTLRPGDQAVTSASLEMVPVRDDVAWSRDMSRLVPPAAASAPTHAGLLLERAPASTVFYVGIPKPAGFLEEVQRSLRGEMSRSPELRGFESHQVEIENVLTHLQGATAYLNGGMAILAFTAPDGKVRGPVFLAQTGREGLAGFLSKAAGHPIASAARPGMLAFSPDRAALDAFMPALDAAPGAFRGSPCFDRIAGAERDGSTLVTCADLRRQASGAPRYFLASAKDNGPRPETRATIGFDGPRTGIAAWLAPPAPMGSLDYVSPEATAAAAFVVKSPAAIVDEILALRRSPESEKALEDARKQAGIDFRNGLAAPLGGEFALALDGAAFPVPAWKLIVEVYDPTRFQEALQKVVEAYNRETAKKGSKPLRTSRETIDGRVYYMLAGADPNPLTEAHYTFSDGYLVAGPSTAVVTHALQVKAARTSITRSSQFIAMTPRDHYANFSALIYQNLGTTLAPLSGILGALAGNLAPGQSSHLPDLSHIQPSFVAAYGEPDRITIATVGNSLGIGPSTLMHGSLAGVVGGIMPQGKMPGTRPGGPAFR